MDDEKIKSISDLNLEFILRRAQLNQWYVNKYSELRGEGLDPNALSQEMSNQLEEWLFRREASRRGHDSDNQGSPLMVDGFGSMTLSDESRLIISCMQVSYLRGEAVALRKILETPITRKVNLKALITSVLKKLVQFWVIWLMIAAILAAVALFIGKEGSSYAENLYTTLMAYTTIGFGDVPPGDSFIARASAILVGLLGVFTVGVFVTVVWSAAQESNRMK